MVYVYVIEDLDGVTAIYYTLAQAMEFCGQPDHAKWEESEDQPRGWSTWNYDEFWIRKVPIS